MKQLEQVQEFHLSFDHPVLTTPQIPNKQRAHLRWSLLKEEVQEFKEAIETGDLVGVADAFADIQYVLMGAVLEFGLAEKFVEIFNEVHRSNMSKACTTLKEAEETIKHHEALNAPCHYIERNGLWFVYRTEDMKTMKSINYSPAGIESIIK